jgi:hypothetical protein
MLLKFMMGKPTMSLKAFAMTEKIIYNDQNEAIKTPVIEVETDLGKFALDHLNTSLRIFGPGYEDIQYVRHTPRGRVIGLEMEEDTFKQLLEHGYPIAYKPVPDSAEIEWFVRTQLELFDDQAAALLAPTDDEALN